MKFKEFILISKLDLNANDLQNELSFYHTPNSANNCLEYFCEISFMQNENIFMFTANALDFYGSLYGSLKAFLDTKNEYKKLFISDSGESYYLDLVRNNNSVKILANKFALGDETVTEFEVNTNLLLESIYEQIKLIEEEISKYYPQKIYDGSFKKDFNFALRDNT